MNIPKKIKVGGKLYSVEVVEAMRERGRMGHIQHDKRTIQIGKRSNISGKAYKADVIEDTFWHELVHGILEDMGEHRLNNNEQFVTRFANRLTKAIQSARF